MLKKDIPFKQSDLQKDKSDQRSDKKQAIKSTIDDQLIGGFEHHIVSPILFDSLIATNNLDLSSSEQENTNHDLVNNLPNTSETTRIISDNSNESAELSSHNIDSNILSSLSIEESSHYSLLDPEHAAPLQGSIGNDTLIGDDSDDLIFGLEGDDDLTGGEGSDLFIFNANNSTNHGDDIIGDFEINNDTLQLNIDDLIAPNDSDLTHALDSLVTVQDNGPSEDITIQFNDGSHGSIILQGLGTEHYSSIQDLLDAGMNIDIINQNG